MWAVTNFHSHQGMHVVSISYDTRDKEMKKKENKEAGLDSFTGDGCHSLYSYYSSS